MTNSYFTLENRTYYKLLFLALMLSCITLISMYFSHNIYAQSGNIGLAISPAFTESSIGDSFAVKVYNSSNSDYTFKANPVFIKYFRDGSGGTTAEFVDNSQLNVQEYLSIDQEEFTIKSGDSIDINVKYLKKAPELVLGVRISEIVDTTSSDQLSLGADMVSVVLDFDISAQDLDNIQVSIEVNPIFSIGPIAIANEYDLKLRIINESLGFIKPAGELEVSKNETRYKSLPFTQKIQGSILPGEEFEIDLKYIDDRGVFDKFGTSNFVGNIKMGNQSISVSQSILIIPWELALGGFSLLIIVVAVIIFIFRKRQLYTSRNSNLNFKFAQSKKSKNDGSGYRF